MVMTLPPAYHPGNFLMKNMNPTNSGLILHIFACAVTGICVSQGCVFPAHISLGMRVSPHTYH